MGYLVRTLVTGAGGFIGGQLVRDLEHHGIFGARRRPEALRAMVLSFPVRLKT